MDTIKLLGIDLKDPKIYLQVKKVIDRWIKQLSNLK
jgi:hypothetical protein